MILQSSHNVPQHAEVCYTSDRLGGQNGWHTLCHLKRCSAKRYKQTLHFTEWAEVLLQCRLARSWIQTLMTLKMTIYSLVPFRSRFIIYSPWGCDKGDLLEFVGVFLCRLAEEGGVGVCWVLPLRPLCHTLLGRSCRSLLGWTLDSLL